jgi:hypothetical protein
MNYGFRRSIKKLTVRARQWRPVEPALAETAQVS